MSKIKEQGTKVTVIVTVHNSEKYLRECMDSVCSQTMREIEILCVDGGSTDSSPEILREYQERDERIRILNDANTSYGHKINIGVQEAKGKYVAILETDDCMKRNMLERLYILAEEHALDYVDADYDAFFEMNSKIFRYKINKYSEGNCYGYLSENEDSINALKCGASGAIWTGLYNRKFLMEQQIFMFESAGAAYQDTSFRFLVCMLAKKAYHLPEALYQYRMDNVESSVKDLKKIYTIAEEYDFLKKELINRNVSNKSVWNVYYQWKYESYYWNIFRLTGSAREVFLTRYREELKADVQKNCIPKENMADTVYRNTFMLLEEPELFMSYVEKSAKAGNLALKNLCGLVCKIGEKKIVIFGSGIRGKRVLQLYEEYPEQICCLCDNNEAVHNTCLNGHKILPVTESVSRYPEAIFVIANLKYANDMRQQLLDLKVSADNICIYE